MFPGLLWEHIHWQEQIASFDHRIASLEQSARIGTRSHGDDVLGLGHLIVEQADAAGHLVSDGACQNQGVGLSRGGTEQEAETIGIGARTACLHELDRAAGRSKEQIPLAMFGGQVEQLT